MRGNTDLCFTLTLFLSRRGRGNVLRGLGLFLGLLALLLPSGCGKMGLVQPPKVLIPPTVASSSITDVTPMAATLRMRVTGLGSASTVYISFVYSSSSLDVFNVTTPPLASATKTLGNGFLLYESGPLAVTETGVLSLKVSGLQPDTPYSLRWWAIGDGTAIGPNMDFRTPK